MRSHVFPAWENMGYHTTLWVVKRNHGFYLPAREKFESNVNRLRWRHGGIGGGAGILSAKYSLFVLVDVFVGKSVGRNATPCGAIAPDGL